MRPEEVREILKVSVNTLMSHNLYASYEVGGLQLSNMLEVCADYVMELDKQYPGIRAALIERRSNY